jgi:ribonuclease HI
VIIVSTDGSCLRNPGGAIGWAWVAHDGGRFDSGGAASGTNQIAELTAVLRAIEANPGQEPLLIEADSQYAIRSASEWLPGWKRKGWRTASGGPVKNLELIQAIDAAMTAREGPVRFHWVRGHVGNPFNERADELAGIAARDWEAGRGDVGHVLIADDDDGQGPRPQAAPPRQPTTPRQPSPRPKPAAPRWESGTLFD